MLSDNIRKIPIQYELSEIKHIINVIIISNSAPFLFKIFILLRWFIVITL